MDKKSNAGFGVREPITKEVKRQQYSLDHWALGVGAIGGLQTLSVIPVVAGDSISIDMSGVFRLSPLRRNLYLDSLVDLFAFYIPHRHIYGDSWIDFMKKGVDEDVTLGVDTLALGNNCLGARMQDGGTWPRWRTRGYIQIWNRYFRDPSDVAGVKAEDYWVTFADGSDATVHFGLPTCHLKRIWNTALLSTLATADYRLALDGGEVDLYNLSQLQGRLKTEIDRDWFALRYADLMSHTFNSKGVNIDADKRPELLMRSSTWLSGHDVDGTDVSTLGTYSGKAAGLCNLSFPSKFFPEHKAKQ